MCFCVSNRKVVAMIYLTRNLLRLQYSKTSKQNIRIYSIQVIKTVQNTEKLEENKQLESLLKENKDKITFSSYLDHEKLNLGYHKYYLKTLKQVKISQIKKYEEKSLSPLPIVLQYYVDSNRLIKDETYESDKPVKKFQLPFANTTKVNNNCDNIKLQTEEKNNSIKEQSFKHNHKDIDKWMTNYEYFNDAQLKVDEQSDDESIEQEWCKFYGTPDLGERVSHIPCGGCGALFHCNDPSIPGYLPSEIYKNRSEVELKTMECQRCHFFKEYNIALDVSVNPEEYEKLLQSVRNVKSLILLMIDLLDFPCSIWPGIINVIGDKRPIIIVANKVDLLPGDSVGYLKRIKECLMSEINKTSLKNANIKHVSLISAKTGYGVEDLISAMFKTWLGKGDVFLVGCTNVGKSSLFNSLLQSDYCKVHAVDIVKRATVSQWPGTTLNLLKFPINRPDGWKIYQRTKRLQSEARMFKVEKEIRKGQLQESTVEQLPALIGHIGRTFSDSRHFDDMFSGSAANKMKNNVLNERDEVFRNSKWFYDTPGVVHPDQILSLLTTEELLLTIPKELIRPKTYYLYEGSTIFIGGLARIDHLECTYPCRFTIFCSDGLPITVTKTEHADEVYEKFLGTELFSVPIGETERLKNWPGLMKNDNLFEFSGEGPKCCCGDIVLSSVGWVSVTAKHDSICKVAAWTPQGRGIYRRYPSLLPYSINLKGRRIRDTPAYMIGNIFVENK